MIRKYAKRLNLKYFIFKSRNFINNKLNFSVYFKLNINILVEKFY